MKKIIPAIILTIIIIGALIFAAPQFPHLFEGKVIYDGDDSYNLEGQEITVKLNGIQIENFEGIVGEDNDFSVLVDTFGENGEIVFYIGGAEASPSFEYEINGETFDNLTIFEMPSDSVCGDGYLDGDESCDGEEFGFATCWNVMLIKTGNAHYQGNLSCSSSCNFDVSNCSVEDYCGDQTCDAGESCSSCSTDCGACASSGGGSSGGGGGGGSGGGGGGGSSGGAASTSTSNNVVTLSTNSTLDDETLDSEENSTSEDANTRKGITGLAIGDFVKTTKGKISIVVLAVIVLVLIFIFAKKKSGKKKSKK